MQSLRVAVVSKDPGSRLTAARAFDRAPAHWDVSLHAEVPKGHDVVVFGDDMTVGEPQIDRDAPERIVEQISSLIPTNDHRSIVVTGGCGGTGTTTIALHIAAALARTEVTCALDLSGGMAERLGIDPTNARTWDGGGVEGIELSALPVQGGFRALLKGDPDSKTPPDLAPAILDRFERVVVDAPSMEVPTLLASGGSLVSVTSGSPIAASRTARALKDLPSCRLAVVVNRVGRGGQTPRVELERILGRRIALELPHCPALRDVEDEVRLLTSPIHKWKRDIDRLAAEL